MIKSLPESPEPSDIGIETLCTVGADRKNCCKFVELVNIRRYLSGAGEGNDTNPRKPSNSGHLSSYKINSIHFSIHIYHSLERLHIPVIRDENAIRDEAGG